ncbi:MAG: efflux RND transporter periplasmic adaptor subunit [Gemmatimonadetes bacterium]|nr:efflux RND transporter periplasmic adaptor subunit [Gemmatimonadota bacterium]
MTSATRRSALLLSLVALAACGKKSEEAAPAAPPVQSIGPDNIAVARLDTLRSGPAISGTLVADREARLRAELSASVLQVMVDAGQRVSAGMTLGRLDDAAVRDLALSAKSGVATAKLAADQAAREFKRAQTLLAAGAIAERDAEGAERAHLAAQAQLADAEARLASADKAQRSTIIKAPFDGIIAEKSVSPGDVVSPGTPLFTVIDPRSLRVEASVPATALGDVKVGAPVTFTVNGASRELVGRITRVNPMVNAQTRQVGILASVPNTGGSLVAGLFVEGRIASQARSGVLVPEQAVDQTGIVPFVMRLRGGKVEKAEVQVGLRDEKGELLEITTGLAGGDTVLLGAARGISVGSSVSVSAPRDAAAPAAPAAPASTKH